MGRDSEMYLIAVIALVIFGIATSSDHTMYTCYSCELDVIDVTTDPQNCATPNSKTLTCFGPACTKTSSSESELIT